MLHFSQAICQNKECILRHPKGCKFSQACQYNHDPSHKIKPINSFLNENKESSNEMENENSFVDPMKDSTHVDPLESTQFLDSLADKHAQEGLKLF